MLNSKKRQQGATLLEAMLVIAIGSSIVFMSIQVYQRYRHDADAYQVQANVNAIFQAMTGFYKANCRGFLDGTDKVVPGKLNPAVASGDNVAVNISNDLLGSTTNPAFLDKPISGTSIVDATGPNNGYVVQFNRTTGLNRQICKDGTVDAKGKLICNSGGWITNIGELVMWRAQVAVKLNNPANAKTYLGLLGGDCLSKLAGSIVTPCATSGNSGDYVVWERLPSSVANAKALSPFWSTMPVVNQFTQMYENYPISTLTNGALIDGQKYLCNN